MSSQFKLAQLTSAYLSLPEAVKFLPELLPLQTTVEKNIAHDSQTVFNHTISVMVGLEKFFNKVLVLPELQPKLTDYLNQKIGSNSKKDLLRLLVLVHDLAKNLALVTDPTGKTSCPGHEILAAARVGEFKDRFGLVQTEIDYVAQLVRLHGLPHEVLTLGLTLTTQQQSIIIQQFDRGTGSLGIELMIMVYADILGGDFARSRPSEYSARLELCQNWLTELALN